jgi:heptosyltransferase-1
MRILIVKLSSLGDLFHALPAVHSLKVGFDAEIDWVAHSGYVELAACFDDVDRVIPFYRHGFFRNLRPFIKALRAKRYDIVVDLQGLLKSAVTGTLARRDALIGPSFAREGARLFYDGVAGSPDRERHAVEQNMDVLAYLGIEPQPVRFPVTFPAPEARWLGKAPARPRIALIPCSRWETKNWPPASFIETARRLRKEHGATIVLLGGAGDAPVCAAIAEGVGEGVINLAGRTSLVEMGSLLADMDLVIGSDSGPAHMAVAAGTPTIALFGPTSPSRTGAYGDGHRVITAEGSCSGCYRRMCDKATTLCMAGIAVDDVVTAAGRLLA